MKAWPWRVTSAATTLIWQFVILPAEPVYESASLIASAGLMARNCDALKTKD